VIGNSESAAGDALANVIAAKVGDAEIQSLLAIGGILRRISGVDEVGGEDALQFAVSGISPLGVFRIEVDARVEVRPFVVKSMEAREERLQRDLGLIAERHHSRPANVLSDPENRR
jgi:hypothetical protein